MPTIGSLRYLGLTQLDTDVKKLIGQELAQSTNVAYKLG